MQWHTLCGKIFVISLEKLSINTLGSDKMTLKELGIGQSARILTVGGEGALRQHFLDMGVIPKAEVTVIKFAPMGDPMELQVHGYELTLRLDDAAQIEVELIDSRSRKHEGPKKISNTAHPGLGEEGKYHVKGSGNPIPDGKSWSPAVALNTEFTKSSCMDCDKIIFVFSLEFCNA
mgnify:CR=1 FL=1